MSVPAERLPKLIEDAATALAKATNAGEVLEAHDKAKLAYDAAKSLSHLKVAHDEVVSACRKVMGDALIIEQRAKCRLADEYDAAQERGEVAKGGNKSGKAKSTIPNENSTPTVTDIGLTSKIVHEARKARDAEKKNPGIIQRTVETQLKDGKEPTRAAIKRAIKKKPAVSSLKKEPKPDPKIEARNKRIIALGEKDWSAADIAAEVGIVERLVHQVLERERKVQRELARRLRCVSPPPRSPTRRGDQGSA